MAVRCRRCQLRARIFSIAVKAIFNKAAQGHAVFNPHTILVVNFHYDAVIRRNGQIGQKIILVFQPFVN